MSKKRILLVDDEAGFTRLLRLILRHFEVWEENESTRALATARRFRPDLIFMDVIMPGANGETVAAAMRADPLLANTPIVFLTAIVKSSEGNGLTNIGGYPFLAKPISKDKLMECIHRYLPAQPAENC